MRYYPVCLDVMGRHCLVVGGGDVGTRKALTLLSCGAIVKVVSPEATDRLISIAEEGRLVLKKTFYRPSDLDGVFLVIGATDRSEVNLAIAREAEALGILHNIADDPEESNFILPAVVTRGDLQLTVSTSGKSPALARQIRMELESRFGEEYAVMLQLMGVIRERLLAAGHDPQDHRARFLRLTSGNLLDLLREGDAGKIDLFLVEVLGSGFTLADLGIRLSKMSPDGAGEGKP